MASVCIYRTPDQMCIYHTPDQISWDSLRACVCIVSIQLRYFLTLSMCACVKFNHTSAEMISYSTTLKGQDTVSHVPTCYPTLSTVPENNTAVHLCTYTALACQVHASMTYKMCVNACNFSICTTCSWIFLDTRWSDPTPSFWDVIHRWLNRHADSPFAELWSEHTSRAENIDWSTANHVSDSSAVGDHRSSNDWHKASVSSSQEHDTSMTEAKQSHTTH